MKEIAVLNGELNGIHETLATLKTQLCARSHSEPSHALSPRHHTLAMHASPTENEHAIGRAHLRLCLLADMAASATTSTWRRTPRALELERPVNRALIKSVQNFILRHRWILLKFPRPAAKTALSLSAPKSSGASGAYSGSHPCKRWCCYWWCPSFPAARSVLGARGAHRISKSPHILDVRLPLPKPTRVANHPVPIVAHVARAPADPLVTLAHWGRSCHSSTACACDVPIPCSRR